jgi:DNA-binding CsgD family transcriptional regulator
MVAVFLGLSGLALILLVLLHGGSKSAQTFKAIRNFLIMSFLVGGFYFFFYYKEVILKVYDLGAIGRAADYAVTLGFIFAWITLVHQLIGTDKFKKLYFWTKIAFAVDFLVEGAMAVFVLDDYYYVADSHIREVAATGHVVFMVFAITVILIYMVKGMKEIRDSVSRRFVIGISILLIIFKITGLVFSIDYLYGIYGVTIGSAWGGKTFDPTGVLLIAMNLITIIFVYKTDFNPLFSISSVDPKNQPDGDLSMAIDLIAVAHRLTVREREILILAYNGYTNPDIAQKLNISFNTAKRHMHHIFEKLDVSTRIELVHLINSQM